MVITDIFKCLKSIKGNLIDEKVLQLQVLLSLQKQLGDIYNVQREFRLDSESVIDFLIDDSIGIEVKIKGQKRAIYKQCERYCQFEKINSLILLTNVSIGFPKEINDKDCYVINLSKAWL